MASLSIIFDCDGVLVDSEPLAAQAYVQVYAKHGLSITADTIGKCVGMKQTDIINRIAELTGCRLPADAAADLWPELRVLFDTHLTTTPGMADFLTEWTGKRCVASSSSLERIDFSLKRTGLAGFFGADVFSTSMVARGKPAPDIFLFAAERMGVCPDTCIVVEDSPFGIEGARAAGALAIGYVGGGHCATDHAAKLLAVGAHSVVGSWSGLAALLNRLA